MAANVADEQSIDAAGTGTSISKSIVLAVGDFCEVFVDIDSNTADSITVSGVTDTDGAGHFNTYTQIKHINNADDQSLTSFASSQVTVPGTYTVTAALSATTPFRGIYLKRIAGSSGIDTGPSSRIAANSSFVGTGTNAVTSGNVTPSSAGALISACASCTHGGGPTITKGTGFTDSANSTVWPTIGPGHGESLHVATTAAVAATFTSNQNNVFEVIAHTWLDVSSVVNTKSILDSITIADILAGLQQLVRVVTDLFTVTDSVTRQALLTRVSSDAIVIVDAESRLTQINRSMIDGIAIVDIETRFALYLRNVIDTLTLVDIITALRSGISVRAIVDAFVAADVQARFVLSRRNIAELFLIADAQFKIEFHTRIDTLGITDLEIGTSATIYARLLTDPFLLGELIARNAQYRRAPIADAFVLTDSNAKGAQSFLRRVLDAIALVDLKVAQFVPFSTAKTRVVILIGANDEPRLGAVQPITLDVADNISLGSYQ